VVEAAAAVVEVAVLAVGASAEAVATPKALGAAQWPKVPGAAAMPRQPGEARPIGAPGVAPRLGAPPEGLLPEDPEDKSPLVQPLPEAVVPTTGM